LGTSDSHTAEVEEKQKDEENINLFIYKFHSFSHLCSNKMYHFVVKHNVTENTYKGENKYRCL